MALLRDPSCPLGRQPIPCCGPRWLLAPLRPASESGHPAPLSPCCARLAAPSPPPETRTSSPRFPFTRPAPLQPVMCGQFSTGVIHTVGNLHRCSSWCRSESDGHCWRFSKAFHDAGRRSPHLWITPVGCPVVKWTTFSARPWPTVTSAEGPYMRSTVHGEPSADGQRRTMPTSLGTVPSRKTQVRALCLISRRFQQGYSHC